MDPKMKSAKLPVPPDPKMVADKMTKARKGLEEAFVEFKKLFDDKVLAKNKTDAKKNTEKQTVDKVYKAAAEIEMNNAGEGVMSLGVINLRMLLSARDRMNELEYLLYSLIKLNNLKVPDEQKGKS